MPDETKELTPMRKLTRRERKLARGNCYSRGHTPPFGCSFCRAETIALVDGAPEPVAWQVWREADAETVVRKGQPRIREEIVTHEPASHVGYETIYGGEGLFRVIRSRPPVYASPGPVEVRVSQEDIAYLDETWRRPMAPVGDSTFRETKARIIRALTPPAPEPTDV